MNFLSSDGGSRNKLLSSFQKPEIKGEKFGRANIKNNLLVSQSESNLIEELGKKVPKPKPLRYDDEVDEKIDDKQEDYGGDWGDSDDSDEEGLGEEDIEEEKDSRPKSVAENIKKQNITNVSLTYAGVTNPNDEKLIKSMIGETLIMSKKRIEELNKQLLVANNSFNVLKFQYQKSQSTFQQLLDERDEKISSLQKVITTLKNDRDVYKNFFREQTFSLSDMVYPIMPRRVKSTAAIIKNFLTSCYNLDRYITKLQLKNSAIGNSIVPMYDKIVQCDISEISENGGYEFSKIIRHQYIPTVESILYHALRKDVCIYDAVKDSSYYSMLLGKINVYKRMGRGECKDEIIRSFICKLINEKVFSKFFNWWIENDEFLGKYYYEASILRSMDDTKVIYRRVRKINKYSLKLKEDCDEEGELLVPQEN